MNYENIYEKLYQLGYHGDGTNTGAGKGFIFPWRYRFDSIIDAGCSQGLAVKKYLNMGKDAWGFDISPKAIELSKQLGLHNRCVVGSILDIPFSKKSFDALVSCDVLEHLNKFDIDLALDEIFRVTRKYLFLRIATSAEGRKDWLEKLKEEYPNEFDDIDNLHLSIFPHKHWIELVVKKGAKFLEKTGKTLIFEII